ncbi:hypothetical protein KIPB_000893 [Kipferlia bialata]|uniref:Uncharacterized protein n=1 Tax=Kipferlia bialata TaxID=797122 RepID=A0A9K3GDT3_9EUKA|nr:hypothetical protein KIPB_000893 [Kipferlia bialata]|eukprot:g893.t1
MEALVAKTIGQVRMTWQNLGLSAEEVLERENQLNSILQEAASKYVADQNAELSAVFEQTEVMIDEARQSLKRLGRADKLGAEPFANTEHARGRLNAAQDYLAKVNATVAARETEFSKLMDQYTALCTR